MISSDQTSLLRVAFPSNATAQQPPQYCATSYATTTQHPPLKPASLLDLARNKLRNNHATSSKKDVQQAHQKQGVDVARLELINLVRFVADFHGFTKEEHDEALAIALADLDNALVCFRALKQDALSTGSSKRFKLRGNSYPSREAKELNLSLPSGEERNSMSREGTGEGYSLSHMALERAVPSAFINRNKKGKNSDE